MPRVHKRTARGSRFDRRCNGCSGSIEPGQEFYTWRIKSSYGGTNYYRHAEHGPPEPGMLTHSKMGVVYDAQKTASNDLPEALSNVEPDSYEDAVDAVLNGLAEQVREVEQEYRDAYEAAPGLQADSEMRADELSSWADELEGFSTSTSVPDKDDYDDEDGYEEALEEMRESLISEAQEIIDNCPL